MDIVIQLAQVIAAARLLAQGEGGADLEARVRVTLPNSASKGGTMSISYNRKEVFHMSVTVEGQTLTLDRSHSLAEGDVGWGTLGMILALRYGMARGCTRVRRGGDIVNADPKQRAAAYRYWQGIPETKRGVDLVQMIVTTMLKINRTGAAYGNVRQTDPPPDPLDRLGGGPPRRGTGGSTSVVVIRTINHGEKVSVSGV